METPPCSEAHCVGGFPGSAGADPSLRWDDRQGGFGCLMRSRSPGLDTRDDRAPAERSGSPGQEVTHPTALDTPRLRMRRASAMVLGMFVQSPVGHHGRETSQDCHGARKAVCGVFLCLRGGPLVPLHARRMIAWREAP
jgi:hypothetical protein